MYQNTYQFAQEDSTPSCVTDVLLIFSNLSMCTRRLVSKVYQIMYQCAHSSFKVYQNVPTCAWRLKCTKMYQHAQEDSSSKCSKTCSNVQKKTYLTSVPKHVLMCAHFQSVPNHEPKNTIRLVFKATKTCINVHK